MVFPMIGVFGNVVLMDQPGHPQAPDLKQHQLSWKQSVDRFF